jgi:hypothetical protein
MILSGARDLADPPLDPLRLAASNAIDLQITRRRSARHERYMRLCIRCVFFALAVAIAVRILLG